MQMKSYLREFFEFNNQSNKKQIKKIKELPDKAEALRLFSHLINAQNKWLARVLQDTESVNMSWMDPVYEPDSIEEEWDKSLKRWIIFLDSKTEEELLEIVQYTGMDGGRWEAALKDIILQLNYHAIHHRAQIQTIIRKQGLEPDFLDYIGTKYRKIS